MTRNRRLSVVSRTGDQVAAEVRSQDAHRESRCTTAALDSRLLPLRERDAARYIGMSVAFLRQARMRARGPAYFRIGRSIRYRVSDLDVWLSARRVTTRDQAA